MREENNLTLEELAEKLRVEAVQKKIALKVTKYQLSHIENNKRTPNEDILGLLIDVLKPNLEQLKELHNVCIANNIGIILPPELRTLQPINSEVFHQKEFDEIYVISEVPVEVSQINEKNEFLMQLVNELKNKKSPHYVYWITESSLERFLLLFEFLEKNGVERTTIDETFEIIVAPKELCILSYAIYSPNSKDSFNNMNRGKVGRILVRNDDLSIDSFKVVSMGDSDMRNVYSFLQGKHDELKIKREITNYVLYTPQNIRESNLAFS